MGAAYPGTDQRRVQPARLLFGKDAQQHVDDEQHAVDAEEHLPDGALFADIAHLAQELLSGFLHGQNLLVVYHTKKAAG